MLDKCYCRCPIQAAALVAQIAALVPAVRQKGKKVGGDATVWPREGGTVLT